MKDIINEFDWHSALGFEYSDDEKKKISKLPNVKKARKMFIASDDGTTLIHKTSQCLWKVSEDGQSIEAVFDSDVLTEDDMKELEE